VLLVNLLVQNVSALNISGTTPRVLCRHLHTVSPTDNVMNIM